MELIDFETMTVVVAFEAARTDWHVSREAVTMGDDASRAAEGSAVAVVASIGRSRWRNLLNTLSCR